MVNTGPLASTPARAGCRAHASGVSLVFVVRMRAGFELDRWVLDVGVCVEAPLQLVEHRPELPVMEPGVINDNVCGPYREPRRDLARVQAVYMVL